MFKIELPKDSSWKWENATSYISFWEALRIIMAFTNNLEAEDFCMRDAERLELAAKRIRTKLVNKGVKYILDKGQKKR